MIMKTLYVSDLDGTLLRNDAELSGYTADTLNRFIRNGGLFTYATARSIYSAAQVTARLKRNIPAICYNGAFIVDPMNETIYSQHFSDDEIKAALEIFYQQGIFPVVYAWEDGAERIAYHGKYVNSFMRIFLEKRAGNPRLCEVDNENDLYSGNIYRFVCIDEPVLMAELDLVFETDTRFSCIYERDPYTFLELCDILPTQATKANASLQLKKMLGCEKMVVFGDGENDITLFTAADEKYAMQNALPELKEIATAVIDSNDNDGVAKWIKKNVL